MNHVILTGRTAAMLGIVAFILHATPAFAHGFAGKRFFPATITTDDPFVADELSLPTVAYFKNGDRPAADQTDISFEWSKRILDTVGVSVEDTWTYLDQRREPNKSGFQNPELNVKYQFLTNASHEAIVSAGLTAELGDTGARQVGAESFSTLAPTLYFGKGAGDLPASLDWARPFAVTGVVSYTLPTDSGHTMREFSEDTGEIERSVERHPQSVAYGFALEYSLPYLQANVRDLGLPEFFDKLIPLVEVAVDTPVQNRGGESTTATINPGVIWTGQHFQVGAEAILPLNRDSGTGRGRHRSAPFLSGRPVSDDDRQADLLKTRCAKISCLAWISACWSPSLSGPGHMPSWSTQAHRWAGRRAHRRKRFVCSSARRSNRPSRTSSSRRKRGMPSRSGPVSLDPNDSTRLVAAVPSALAPGVYKVSWRVVSVDTHSTEGDYTFEVKP